MRPPEIVRLVAWVALIGGFCTLLFFGWQTFRWRLETGDTFPEYSTYRADPKGLKAFYESLLATGQVHVSRRMQSSKILPSGENQVLVLAGIRADQPTVLGEDSQFLDHWLATGGRIVFALRPEKNQLARDQAAPLENQDETDPPPNITWRSLFRRWGVGTVPLRETRSTTTDSTLFGKISRWLGRDSFDRLTSGWKVIAVQDGKNVIVERAFGHGSLVLLADSYPLSNEALATDRNTVFLLWLMDNRSGVLFDETHLGLNERPGIMTLAQRYGLQGTVISIVAVLLLFIWKCQYTLVPRTRTARDGLTVSGTSSDQAFLNLLRRNVSQKKLMSVCIKTWLRTARPTSAQLARLEEFRVDPGEKKSAAERYNQITTLLNEKL
ncbi:MAG TPA: DUF4350 domain-containing protein [Chthoniobacterales bacterium]|jgi:hypothetical protein|nr:DUF4350 domain-containing protein [Chthoniobacterales bacterium]